MDPKCPVCNTDVIMIEQPNFHEPHLFPGNWKHWTCPKCNAGRHDIDKEANMLQEIKKLYEQCDEMITQIEDLAHEPLVEAYLIAQMQLLEMKKTLNEQVQEYAEGIPVWKPDRFTKGKKEVYVSDKMRFYRSTRKIRTVKPADFIDKFPFVANEMITAGEIKIPVGTAEKAVGKKELAGVCSTEIKHSYELVIRNDTYPSNDISNVDDDGNIEPSAPIPAE